MAREKHLRHIPNAAKAAICGVVGQTKAVKRRGIALSDWGCEEAPP